MVVTSVDERGEASEGKWSLQVETIATARSSPLFPEGSSRTRLRKRKI
jgi:hypothetical protein